MIEKKADLSKPDQNGDTPLHMAHQYGYPDVIKYLENKRLAPSVQAAECKAEKLRPVIQYLKNKHLAPSVQVAECKAKELKPGNKIPKLK